MVTINKKGTFCLYKPCLLCQEGYCQDCLVYLSRTRDIKKRMLEWRLSLLGC